MSSRIATAPDFSVLSKEDFMNSGWKLATLSAAALAFTIGASVPAMAQGRCAASKIKAVCKKEKCLLGVEAKACLTGTAADAAKAQKCRDKFASTFAKLDAKGGCLTSGDAAATETKVDAFVADVDSELCTVPAGDSGRCGSAKIKASAKKACCLLGLEAKQASRGGAIDPTRAQKCRDQHASTFARYDARGGCATTGDAAAQEAKVDAFVADADAELSAASTTTTITTPTTSTITTSTSTSITITTTTSTTSTTVATCANGGIACGDPCGTCGDGVCVGPEGSCSLDHCGSTAPVCVRPIPNGGGMFVACSADATCSPGQACTAAPGACGTGSGNGCNALCSE